MIFSGYSGFSSIKADSRIITELLMRVVLNTISLPLPFPLLHIWTINTSNYIAWHIDFSKTKTSACSEDRSNICPFLIHNILTGLYNYSKSNPTGNTSRARTAYPSGAPDFTSDFKRSSCYSIYYFLCSICRTLVVSLSCFCWSLYCLCVFFRFTHLIIRLVSSNFS